jgi:integrase
MHPAKPVDLSTPGLNWRPRKGGWIAYWIARADIVERGYPLKSVRVWPPSTDAGGEPTADEWRGIASLCEKLQAEMLAWGKVDATCDARAIYDGTLASLIKIYLGDPDSPFQGLRHHTKKTYESNLKTLVSTVGQARIPELTFRDFKRWHEGFVKPKVGGGPQRRARAHGLMTFTRIVISFGALLKLAGCRDAKESLEGQVFALPKRRKEIITYEQTVTIRREAHRAGFPSIALAQALMFDLGVRQKDVLGEWVPVTEPSLSEITEGREKWIVGMRLENITNGVLKHRLSKSIRRREALADPDAGKVKHFDLSLYPMVTEEMQSLPGDRQTGPLVVAEHSGLPWRQKVFALKWRQIARTAGVPDSVQNRDSRAGAATEAENAGAPIEHTQKALGHSKPDTTRIYTRNEDRVTAEVAVLRVKNRPRTP